MRVLFPYEYPEGVHLKWIYKQQLCNFTINWILEAATGGVLQLCMWDDYHIFLNALFVFTRLLLDEIYHLVTPKGQLKGRTLIGGFAVIKLIFAIFSLRKFKLVKYIFFYKWKIDQPLFYLSCQTITVINEIFFFVCKTVREMMQ